MTGLKQLALNENNLSDITALSKIKNLEILWLESNKITDISPLKGLPDLKKLYIKGNPISNTGQIDELRSAGVEVDF